MGRVVRAAAALCLLTAALGERLVAVERREGAVEAAGREASVAELRALRRGVEDFAKIKTYLLHNNTGKALLVGHLVQANLAPQLRYMTMLKQMYNSFKYVPEVKELFDQHTRSLSLIPCEAERSPSCPEGLRCSADGDWCLKPGVSLQETVEILLPEFKLLSQKRICAQPDVTADWLNRFERSLDGTGPSDGGVAVEDDTCRASRQAIFESLKELRTWMAKYHCFCIEGHTCGTEEQQQQCLDTPLDKMTWHELFMGLDYALEACTTHRDCKQGHFCSVEKVCESSPCSAETAIGGTCSGGRECSGHGDCYPGEHCDEGTCSNEPCNGPSCPKATLCREQSGEFDEWSCCWSTCGYDAYGLSYRSCTHDNFVLVDAAEHSFDDNVCNFGTRRLCCPRPSEASEASRKSIAVREGCRASSSELRPLEVSPEELRQGSQNITESPSDLARREEFNRLYNAAYTALVSADIEAQNADRNIKEKLGPITFAEEIDFFDMQARRAKTIDIMLEDFSSRCGAGSVGLLLAPQKGQTLRDADEAAQVFRCVDGGGGFGPTSQQWATESILTEVMPQLYQWAMFSCPSLVNIAKEQHANHGTGVISDLTYQVGVLQLMTRWTTECAEWPLPMEEVLAWHKNPSTGKSVIVVRSRSDTGCAAGCIDLGVGTKADLSVKAAGLVNKAVEAIVFDWFSLVTVASMGGFWLWMESAVWVSHRAFDIYDSLRKTEWFNGSGIRKQCMAYAVDAFDRQMEEAKENL